SGSCDGLPRCRPMTRAGKPPLIITGSTRKRRPVKRRCGMTEEIWHADGRIERPEVSFERSDADFGWIMLLLIASAILGAVIFAALLGFFFHYRAYQAAIKRSPFPLAPAPSQALPQEPRLEQVDRLAGVEKPNAYLRELGKEEILNSLGPTPETGYVRIPI